MAASNKVSDMCRLCGTDTLNVIRHHIFEGEGQAKKSAQKIAECLPLQVTAEDLLPKNICGECSYKLDLMSDFRDKAVKTEVMLISLVEGVKPEIPDDDDGPDHEIDNDDFRSDSPVEQPEQQTEPEVLIKEEEAQQHQPEKRPGRKAANKRPIQESDNEEEEEAAAPPAKKRGRKPKETAPAASTTASASTNPPKETTGMEPISNIQPVKTPDLRGHVIKNQGGVSVILCSICAEPFTSFASLGAHMQMHAAEERSRHICDFKGCAKRFENNDQLVLHMKQAHSTPGKSKIWMCTVCDTAYTRLENLTNHFNHEHRVNLTKILAPAPDIKEDDDRSVIRCGICKDRFASYATFLAHLPMHKEIYRCDFESCEQKFRQRKPLVQHIKYDHHTVIWECTSCDFVSSQYPNLNKHVQESHANKPEEKAEVQSATDTQPNKPETKTEIPSLSGTQAKAPVAKKPPETKSVKLIFKCGICQNYMGGEEALAIHMDQHLKTKVYSCDSEGCRKKFASRETLIKHFENFHGVKNRDILCACSLCDSVFIQAVSLHKHQKLKHLAKLEKIEILCSTEGHLKCGICPEKFCTKEALEKHIIGHLRSIERSGSPFCCKRCFQTVPQYRRLTQHYSHLHRTPWPYFDFECEFCPRRFERESRFLEHLKFHRGNGPKCDLCDKQFSTKIALSIHTKNVHARREYVCEICGGRYGLLDNFKRHLLTHNVETVYECSHCEFSSLSKYILRNHIKHHLEKTPKCKICVVCNAKFTSKGQFDYHMGKHTGSDYFQCEVCKKVYTMIRHLREHKKFEHGLLSYKCDSCTKEYTNNKALKKHKLKEHPNNL